MAPDMEIRTQCFQVGFHNGITLHKDCKVSPLEMALTGIQIVTSTVSACPSPQNTLIFNSSRQASLGISIRHLVTSISYPLLIASIIFWILNLLQGQSMEMVFVLKLEV